MSHCQLVRVHHLCDTGRCIRLCKLLLTDTGHHWLFISLYWVFSKGLQRFLKFGLHSNTNSDFKFRRWKWDGLDRGAQSVWVRGDVRHHWARDADNSLFWVPVLSHARPCARRCVETICWCLPLARGEAFVTNATHLSLQKGRDAWWVAGRKSSRSGVGRTLLKIALEFRETESWPQTVSISTDIQKHLQNDKVGSRLKSKNAWPQDGQVRTKQARVQTTVKWPTVTAADFRSCEHHQGWSG